MKKMSLMLLCCSAFLVACDKASEKISDATGDDKNLLDKANSLVNEASKEVGNAANQVTEKVGDSLDNAIDSTVDAAKDTAEKVVATTQESMTAATDSAKASVSNAIESVKDTSANVVSEVSDKADNVVAAVSKEPAVGVDLKEGEKLYKGSCIACHGPGVAGSPKVGEKADWDARIAQGKAVLVDHAINGFRGEEGYYMPAKGGSKHLSDEQVTMIVEYMISTVK